jgi:hypothetical protein
MHDARFQHDQIEGDAIPVFIFNSIFYLSMAFHPLVLKNVMPTAKESYRPFFSIAKIPLEDQSG